MGMRKNLAASRPVHVSESHGQCNKLDTKILWLILLCKWFVARAVSLGPSEGARDTSKKSYSP